MKLGNCVGLMSLWLSLLGSGWAAAQNMDGTWSANMTCSENLVSRAPPYSVGLDFRIAGSSAQAERTDAQSIEVFALSLHSTGEVQLQSTGRLRSDSNPRWVTRFSGKFSGGDSLQLFGQMFIGNGQTLVRERCSLTLTRNVASPGHEARANERDSLTAQLLRELAAGTTSSPPSGQAAAPQSRHPQEDLVAEGSITCSATATGLAAYTQPLRLRFAKNVANGINDSTHSHEIQELVIDADGHLRYSAAGVAKFDDSRWFIRGSGKITGRQLAVTGKMYDSSRRVIRSTCTASLEAHHDVQLQRPGSPSGLLVESVGAPLEFSASTLWGQRAFREWNFELGMPWSFREHPSWSPRPIGTRPLKWTENALAAELRGLMTELPMKAVVLVDGGQVVAALAKPGVTPSTLLPSASMSKSVTALGVGRAVCSGHLSLDTKAAVLMPSLNGRPTGEASLRQLLLMSSGSAETETQHTSGVTFREAEHYLQSEAKSLEDLIADSRLAKSKPAGQAFDYKSYDPYLAALMVQKATGQKFTTWLRDTVFKEAGLEHGFVLDTDRHGNFLATGGVRLTLSDWVRLGIYIQEQRDRSGCFAEFVRDMLRPVITITKTPGVNGHFNGYGFFTWTDADLAPEMGWIAGHFGQRIAVSHRRGNGRVFLTFGDGTDPFMGRIYPLAKRWVH